MALPSEKRRHHLLKRYGVAPPWPYVRPNTAAKALGVDIKTVTGLARAGKLTALRGRTKDGKIVWFIQKDALNTLLTKLERSPIVDTRLAEKQNIQT